MALVASTYRAPAWLPGGHLQTLYAALFAPRRKVSYARQRWETDDGDFIDLDWLQRTDRASTPEVAPTVVLFHGLEGGSDRPYATAMMAALRDIRWRGVVAHFRGCSGENNRLARAYHSGDSAEIDWILRRLRAVNGGAPLYAVGVSLGGNALLKWLGEQHRAASAVITAAAAISAPVDLMVAGEALGLGFNRVYTRNFLTTLKRKMRAKLESYPDLYDVRNMLAARTLREFDDLVTAPLHGFRDTDDYWTRASSKPWLNAIVVPTLMLNARNDPLMPAIALPRESELSSAISAEFPETGGHVSFIDGAFPGHLNWLPQRILRFFVETEMLLKGTRYEH